MRWEFSSAGRASRLHREGREFEPLNSHQLNRLLRRFFYWCGVANLRGASLAQIVRGSELLIVRLAVVSVGSLTAKN